MCFQVHQNVGHSAVNEGKLTQICFKNNFSHRYSNQWIFCTGCQCWNINARQLARVIELPPESCGCCARSCDSKVFHCFEQCLWHFSIFEMLLKNGLPPRSGDTDDSMGWQPWVPLQSGGWYPKLRILLGTSKVCWRKNCWEGKLWLGKDFLGWSPWCLTLPKHSCPFFSFSSGLKHLCVLRDWKLFYWSLHCNFPGKFWLASNLTFLRRSWFLQEQDIGGESGTVLVSWKVSERWQCNSMQESGRARGESDCQSHLVKMPLTRGTKRSAVSQDKKSLVFLSCSLLCSHTMRGLFWIFVQIGSYSELQRLLWKILVHSNCTVIRNTSSLSKNVFT